MEIGKHQEEKLSKKNHTRRLSEDDDDHDEHERGFPLVESMLVVGFATMLLFDQIICKRRQETPDQPN